MDWYYEFLKEYFKLKYIIAVIIEMLNLLQIYLTAFTAYNFLYFKMNGTLENDSTLFIFGEYNKAIKYFKF